MKGLSGGEYLALPSFLFIWYSTFKQKHLNTWYPSLKKLFVTFYSFLFSTDFSFIHSYIRKFTGILSTAFFCCRNGAKLSTGRKIFFLFNLYRKHRYFHAFRALTKKHKKLMLQKSRKNRQLAEALRE